MNDLCYSCFNLEFCLSGYFCIAGDRFSLMNSSGKCPDYDQISFTDNSYTYSSGFDLEDIERMADAYYQSLSLPDR